MRPILIVEDEPAIADLIEMTLEPLGQPLIKAHTGNEAANLLESTLFDLILLDVMLPGVDGFTLMDYIAPTGTPVIFLTAKATVEDRVRYLSAQQIAAESRDFAAEQADQLKSINSADFFARMGQELTPELMMKSTHAGRRCSSCANQTITWTSHKRVTAFVTRLVYAVRQLI